MTTPTPGRPAARGSVRRWPLWVLAGPAAVSIWAGWVGLGQMCGYGVVHPLPGIAEGFELNTAITLPVGMETYSAYALGAWLSPTPLRPHARRFARASALAALGLGLLGQAVFHLLRTLGYTRAPWPVVLFVACLPVLVLGAGATLHHLLATTAATTGGGGYAAPPPAVGGHDTTHPDGHAVPSPGEAIEGPPDPGHHTPAASTTVPGPRSIAAARPVRTPPARRTRTTGPQQRPRRLFADYLTQARAHLTPGVEPTPKWCRQVTGCGKTLSGKLSTALRAEPTTPPPAQPRAREPVGVGVAGAAPGRDEAAA